MTLSLPAQRDVDRWYPLKEHPVQRALVSDTVRFKVVPAGRRCLEQGTLVATPSGPRRIEDLVVGDYVVGFDAAMDAPAITIVTEVHDNGEQLVTPLLSADREYVAATADHKLWACHERSLDARRPHLNRGYQRTAIHELTRRHRVKRSYAFDLIGNSGKSVPLAYVLGALLGDGCSRDHRAVTGQYQRTLRISASDERVPARLAALLGCAARRSHPANHTWILTTGLGALDAVPFYRAWCAGRYAHEKIAVWDELKTWDKASSLAFLAGVIDTDSSIYYKSAAKKEAVLSIAMQSRSVVECCDNIIFKFFQERLSISVDSRDKYKNGPVYSAKTTSNIQVTAILSALRSLLAVKGIDVDLALLCVRNIRADRIGLSQGTPRLARTYDITVGNESNLYCLHHGGIVTSNSGKTERAKRFVAREALRVPGPYFIAAPTRDQVKRIYWADMKRLCFTSQLGTRSVSESELRIQIPSTGSTIMLIGLDQPQRIEGTVWAGGVVDEIANVKPNAWAENISPALDTFNPLRPDYRAWCWLIGVPEGLNHYYKLAEYARTANDPEWGLYHWKSSEILPPEVIEAAKRRMSARQYRQEYEASFEGATGRIYEDYGPANYTSETIQPHEQLMWHHDFNFTPMSSGIGVRRGNNFYVLDEIILISATARQSALEFVDKYKSHQNRSVIIYGDPAGRAGEKHGHASDYTEMEQVLRQNNWKVERRVRPAAPAIKDRQNAVRAKIRNAAGEVSLFVNPTRAPYAHEGLATTQVKEGSTFLETMSDYQHITTAIGYCVHYEWPVQVVKTIDTTIIPIVNHYGKPL